MKDALLCFSHLRLPLQTTHCLGYRVSPCCYLSWPDPGLVRLRFRYHTPKYEKRRKYENSKDPVNSNCTNVWFNIQYHHLRKNNCGKSKRHPARVCLIINDLAMVPAPVAVAIHYLIWTALWCKCSSSLSLSAVNNLRKLYLQDLCLSFWYW